MADKRNALAPKQQRNALTRSLSEDEVYFGYNPIDELRRTVNTQTYTPEQAAANRAATGWEVLGVIPGPGNVISAYDAYNSGSDAVNALAGGDYKGAAISGGLAGLSAAGSVLGLPVGKYAKGAADSGKRALFSGVGPDDTASRMARAKEMGFRDKMDLYHGTNADISAFDLSRGGQTSRSQAGSKGVSVALDPETAGEFADLAAGKSGSGQNIVRLLHRADRPAVLSLDGTEKNLEIAATLDDLWSQGYDAVMMKNYTTPGGAKGRTILVVKDPAQLRSPNAKFDPSKRGSADLLAGVAGGGLLAPALLNSGEDR